MTDRRQFLGLLSTSAVGLAVSSETAAVAKPVRSRQEFPMHFTLNMSTLRGQELTLEEQVDVAAKAGYDGIEPWIRDLETFVERGGELAALRDRIRDA
ncbi:MAG: sugar phosphate isomerase/epimerase, partial [Novipirellula sp. JB048]